MKIVAIYIGLICLSSCDGLIHKSFDENKLTNQKLILKKFINNLGTSGFQGNILVAKNNKIIVNKYVGYHQVQEKKFVYPIASITKPFTAVAILLLKQNGQLKLSDSLKKYYPKLPDDKAEITIKQLLTHTAGFKRDVKLMGNENDTSLLLNSPLIHSTGGKFSYSNAGYMMLATLIEKISKQNYEDFINENIFIPLTMGGTFIQNKHIWQKIPDMKNEFTQLTVFDTNYDKHVLGNSGIVANAHDLFIWFSALTQYKLLNKENTLMFFSSFRKIDHPIQDNYGFGFYQRYNTNKEEIISHGGDIFGYHSELTWMRAENTLIIVLTNTERYSKGVHKRSISNELSKIINNDFKPTLSQIIRDDTYQLSQLLGTYQLNKQNKVKIFSENNQLKLAMSGQETLDIVHPLNFKQHKYIKDRNTVTTRVLKSIFSHDNKELKKLLHQSDYDFFVKDWFNEFKSYHDKLGKFVSFDVLGSDSYPWQENYIRTFVKIQFENKRLNYDFIWKNNRLHETISEEQYDFPLVFNVLVSKGNILNIYDMVTSNHIQIKWHKQFLEIGERMFINSESL